MFGTEIGGKKRRRRKKERVLDGCEVASEGRSDAWLGHASVLSLYIHTYIYVFLTK